MSSNESSPYSIEYLGQQASRCDCCGTDSHRVWGLVHAPEGTVAAYWIHWTVGHLAVHGANLDLVMGDWGDGTSPADRYAVSMIHRQAPDAAPALMVVDARGYESLASTALRRDEVLGRPLAAKVFAITDAIYMQDDRFF